MLTPDCTRKEREGGEHGGWEHEKGRNYLLYKQAEPDISILVGIRLSPPEEEEKMQKRRKRRTIQRIRRWKRMTTAQELVVERDQWLTVKSRLWSHLRTISDWWQTHHSFPGKEHDEVDIFSNSNSPEDNSQSLKPSEDEEESNGEDELAELLGM